MQTQLDLPKDISEGLQHVPRAVLVEGLRKLIQRQETRAQTKTPPEKPTFNNLPPQIAQVITAIEASGGLDADAVPEMKKHSTQFRDEFSLDKDD